MVLNVNRSREANIHQENELSIEKSARTQTIEKASKYGEGKKEVSVTVHPSEGLPFQRKQKVGRANSKHQDNYESRVDDANKKMAKEYLKKNYPNTYLSDKKIMSIAQLSMKVPPKPQYEGDTVLLKHETATKETRLAATMTNFISVLTHANNELAENGIITAIYDELGIKHKEGWSGKPDMDTEENYKDNEPNTNKWYSPKKLVTVTDIQTKYNGLPFEKVEDNYNYRQHVEYFTKQKARDEMVDMKKIKNPKYYNRLSGSIPKLNRLVSNALGMDIKFEMFDAEEDRRGGLSGYLKSKTFAGKESLGIMSHSLSKVEFNVRFERTNEHNKVWCPLHMSWEHHDRGSNGSDAYTTDGKRLTAYYDQIANTWTLEGE